MKKNKENVKVEENEIFSKLEAMTKRLTSKQIQENARKREECARESMKYFVDDLALSVEQLLEKYHASTLSELIDKLDDIYSNIGFNIDFAKKGSELIVKWDELRLTYWKTRYHLKDVAYKQDCEKNNQPVDKEYRVDMWYEKKGKLAKIKQDLMLAIHDRNEVEKLQLESCYQSFGKDQDGIKDWDMNDIPDNNL